MASGLQTDDGGRNVTNASGHSHTLRHYHCCSFGGVASSLCGNACRLFGRTAAVRSRRWSDAILQWCSIANLVRDEPASPMDREGASGRGGLFRR